VHVYDLAGFNQRCDLLADRAQGGQIGRLVLLEGTTERLDGRWPRGSAHRFSAEIHGIGHTTPRDCAYSAPTWGSTHVQPWDDLYRVWSGKQPAPDHQDVTRIRLRAKPPPMSVTNARPSAAGGHQGEDGGKALVFASVPLELHGTLIVV
jgi:hypothetical protein